MDDTLDQMAANIIAQMRRESTPADLHPEVEAYGLDTHVEVERELLAPDTLEPSEHLAPRRAQLWVREHPAQAALVTTVALRWLARLLRRGRRRGRHSG